MRVSLYYLACRPSDSPAHLLDAKLGQSVALAGYTLERDSARPGDSFCLTLFWQAVDKVVKSYTVFAHVVDSTGQPVAQTDSPPLGGTAPTDTWQVGATTIDRYAILIKPNTPPGAYELRVGMYPWPDLTPLPVTLNGRPTGNYVPLTTIRVTP